MRTGSPSRSIAAAEDASTAGLVGQRVGNAEAVGLQPAAPGKAAPGYDAGYVAGFAAGAAAAAASAHAEPARLEPTSQQTAAATGEQARPGAAC